MSGSRWRIKGVVLTVGLAMALGAGASASGQVEDFAGPSGGAVHSDDYLSYPSQVAADAQGFVYAADTGNGRIRRISPAGVVVSILEGLTEPRGLALASDGTLYFTDGANVRVLDPQGSVSMFYLGSHPTSLAVGPDGTVYIAETTNHQIIRVAGGIATSFAGTGEAGFSGDGDLASDAQLSGPEGVAVASDGDVFISDTQNGRIRRVNLMGDISTIKQGLSDPLGLALSWDKKLLVAEKAKNRILELSMMGAQSVFAGTGTCGNSSEGNGSVTSAKICLPRGLAIAPSGEVVFSDGHWRVRKISAGMISTIAGTNLPGPCCADTGLERRLARLAGPRSMTRTSSGTTYIADTQHHRIVKVDASGLVSTIAGDTIAGAAGDGGPAKNARLSLPHGVAVDTSGNVYIADTYNHRIRKVDAAGTITTIAGSLGASGFAGDGGSAASAKLNYPYGIAINAAGDIFIADTNNHRIRKVSGGIITTVAGSGARSGAGDGGLATAAGLNFPLGVAVDPSGALLIADTSNHRIRRVTGTLIHTVAGAGPLTPCIAPVACAMGGHLGDGGPATAAYLNLPAGVTTDQFGNIYIADTSNDRIRLVTPSGTISTFAGEDAQVRPGDIHIGVAYSNLLRRPSGVFIDSVGDAYIADSENHRVARVRAS